MRLAITLNLRDFGHRFACCAPPRICSGHWSAIWTNQFKHQAIGKVAVVRNGQHLAACNLFIIVHIVPQLADGCVALPRIIWKNLVGPAFAIAEHDHTVQIVAAGHQRIFKAHEGGELARFIIPLDERAVACPDACRRFFLPFRVCQGGRQSIAASQINQFPRNALHAFRPLVHLLMPAFQGRVADKKAGRVI